MHGKEVIEKHSHILSVISSTLKAEKNNQLSKLSVGLKKKKKILKLKEKDGITFQKSTFDFFKELIFLTTCKV